MVVHLCIYACMVEGTKGILLVTRRMVGGGSGGGSSGGGYWYNYCHSSFSCSSLNKYYSSL